MAKTVEILRDNLREHPAARAWSVIARQRVEPVTIAVYKAWDARYKSGVYWLAGVGPRGAAVVAKRCSLVTAAVERPIYEEFLPQLSLPTLTYYGAVEDPDGRSCWLFLEAAGGDLYRSDDPEQRALAGRWLAAVHDAGRRSGLGKRLPDRGPEQYLGQLRICRARIAEEFGNPHLTREWAAVLETVFAQCATLDERWSELEAICNQVPRTLIHGDFARKNLRVRPSPGGPELLVFDWEYAGWGTPATDLAQSIGRVASPDLAVYRACLKDDAAIVGDLQLQRLAQCGAIFRILDTMFWACMDLMGGPPEFLIDPISELATYSRRMDRALGEAVWATS